MLENSYAYANKKWLFRQFIVSNKKQSLQRSNKWANLLYVI